MEAKLMAVPFVVPVVDEGLGNSTYLVDLGDGGALVVDPSRDLRAVRAEAARRNLTIAFVAETHLHADFVSGAVRLAAEEGARVLASAAGGREFEHAGLRDGDELDLGGLRLGVLETPGHTAEHLALLLTDGATPVGVFSGGSLLVRSAARTDLVAPHRTIELARAQYASLSRLLTLPDETPVWPTHGAGSFCSAPPGAERTTTVGRERRTNPLLVAGPPDGGDDRRIVDEDTFVTRLLAGLGSYPAYFARLPEVNRRGSAGPATPYPLPALDAGSFAARMAAGAQVVDVRPTAAFAAGHVPGSVSVALRPAFATWLGWVADPDRPLVLVRDPGQDQEEIVEQALKVGFERLDGELAGGAAAWAASGRPVATIPLAGVEKIVAGGLLDVRQGAEYAAGHVPGALHAEAGSLAGTPDLPSGPLTVMCGHGERAMTAASLLARSGRGELTVLDGGPEDWVAATGEPLETGPHAVRQALR
jgi:hydroxyacylglutathione hydrolase